jgi:hypothetical protein
MRYLLVTLLANPFSLRRITKFLQPSMDGDDVPVNHPDTNNITSPDTNVSMSVNDNTNTGTEDNISTASSSMDPGPGRAAGPEFSIIVNKTRYDKGVFLVYAHTRAYVI